jgi:hypothetical protein
VNSCRFRCSHSSGYEEFSLVGYNAVYSVEKQQTAQHCITEDKTLQLMSWSSMFECHHRFKNGPESFEDGLPQQMFYNIVEQGKYETGGCAQ